MVKFNNGMIRFEVSLTGEELNKSILEFVSRVHEIDIKNASIMWDSDHSSNIIIEENMDFGCKINLRSNRTSYTHKIEYKELIVLQESSEDMKNNIIFMLIEYLDLDDHDLARELKGYQIIPKPEEGNINFILTFSL